MLLKDICQFLETAYPLQLQEEYDNAGLIYGHPNHEIRGALVSLDVTEEVVEEAISAQCNLIIAHHPIVFKGLKKLNSKNYVERVVERCIQHGIALYAIHTNLDNHDLGVNAKMAAKIGLENCRILRPMTGLLHKLEVYVPQSHFKIVDQAILQAGAGQIGAYKDCHFRTAGTGTFTPTEGANPYTGNSGLKEEVEEFKLEYVVEAHLLSPVLNAMMLAHPYEEVAYHVLHTQNKHQNRGAGMIGKLAVPMDTLEFLRKIKKTFDCGCIKHTAIVRNQIQTVALCGGAGSFLLPDAIGAKADVYISSDFKYHEFFNADRQLLIADIGHYESEQFTSELLAAQLTEKFPNFAVRLTKLNTNPVNYL
jgi:dinuclear metal center YbgI/SA1388 family protein